MAHPQPGSAGPPSFPPNLAFIPLQLRLMIYDRSLREVFRFRMVRALYRANPLYGVRPGYPVIPALGQVCRRLRNEFIEYYLGNLPWQIKKANGGLLRFRRWIKALGAHGRHLRRFRLICRREHCLIEITLNRGEVFGYTHVCQRLRFMPLLEGDADWINDYGERKILDRLCRKIARNTFKGKHVVAAIDQLVWDIPQLFYNC